jgi:hypothetical protein
MGCKQIAAMGMVGALLGAGSLLATTGSASAGVVARTDRRCVTTTADDKWPASVNGRPANVDPKTASGVYMWHDGTGWHIRATHRGDATRTFSGTITTTGRFVGVSSVRLEGHDSRTVSPDHHVITFRFENHGAIDGLNFRTHCAPSIDFSFLSDGTALAANEVTIGHTGMNPASDPFSIARG